MRTAPDAIPLLEEELNVDAVAVETGQVRLHKRISEEQQQIVVSLLREDVDIERVRVDRVVVQPEPPRQEGDVLIVPLHEEVVTTQWLLTEELHIRRRRSTVREECATTLRREHLDVTRERPRSPGAEQPVERTGNPAGAAGPDSIR